MTSKFFSKVRRFFLRATARVYEHYRGFVEFLQDLMTIKNYLKGILTPKNVLCNFSPGNFPKNISSVGYLERYWIEREMLRTFFAENSMYKRNGLLTFSSQSSSFRDIFGIMTKWRSCDCGMRNISRKSEHF
uniref:ManA protein n=1 Tax=Fopius arisanus TaxID=64838 RepID=A0A0C9QM65_9HYME